MKLLLVLTCLCLLSASAVNQRLYTIHLNHRLNDSSVADLCIGAKDNTQTVAAVSLEDCDRYSLRFHIRHDGSIFRTGNRQCLRTCGPPAGRLPPVCLTPCQDLSGYSPFLFDFTNSWIEWPYSNKLCVAADSARAGATVHLFECSDHHYEQMKGAVAFVAVEVNGTSVSAVSGQCVGDDSRCKDATNTRCDSLKNEGSDCRWESDAEKAGTCSGHDSRCAESSHAACIRLGMQGSDCLWDPPPASGASGKCVGHDSRCPGSSRRACERLLQEGATCKWRAAFSITGNVTLTVSDMDKFVNSSTTTFAVANGLANVTGVPQLYVDVDLHSQRRARRLKLQAVSDPHRDAEPVSGTITATYAIVVPGDAPDSVTATGTEVYNSLQATNTNSIEARISSSVANLYGDDTFKIGLHSASSSEVIEAQEEVDGLGSPDLSGAPPSTSPSLALALCLGVSVALAGLEISSDVGHFTLSLLQ